MSLYTHDFDLPITPGAIPPRIKLSQYDDSRTYTAHLKADDGSAFTLASGATATLHGKNRKGVTFDIEATVSGADVTFTPKEAATDQPGEIHATLCITSGGEQLTPLAITLDIQKDGATKEDIARSPGFEEQIQAAVGAWLEVDGVGEIQSAVEAYADEHGLEYANISVTPAMYGAKADGVTNDAAAIQAALSSGHPVVFEQKTYLVSTPIKVEGKDGIVCDFNGSTIHVASSPAPDDRIGFWFVNCKNILLENLNLYTDLDQTLNIPTGHTAVRTTGSNILAVCFQSCENVVSRNARFKNTNADYWLKTRNDKLLFDGWISVDSTMPMYTERAQNMRVTNFDLRPITDLGNGHHCFYIYGQTDNIRIDHGNLIAPDNNIGSLITTHYSTTSETEIGTDIRVENCRIVYGDSATYIANYGDVHFRDCEFTPLNADVHRLGSGVGNWEFINCKIGFYTDGIQATTNDTGSIVVEGCEINGYAANSCLGVRIASVQVTNSRLNGCQLATQSGTGAKARLKNLLINCGSLLSGLSLFRSTSTDRDVLIEDVNADGNGSVTNFYYTAEKDSAGIRFHNSFLRNFTRVTVNPEEAEYIGVYLDGVNVPVTYADINRVPVSIDTDGTVYNQTGYIEGYRLSSSGSLTALSGSIATGFMRFKNGDVLELSNMAWDAYGDNGGKYCYLAVYDSSFNILGTYNNSGNKSGVVSADSSVTKDGSKYTANIVSTSNDIYYVRVSALWDSSMGTPTVKRMAGS